MDVRRRRFLTDTLRTASAVGLAVSGLALYTRDAGRVVVAGQYTDGGDITINPHLHINRKHLDIKGCWGSDFSHFHRAVRLAADPERSRPWAEIPLETYGLGEMNEALAAVASGEAVKALVDPSRGVTPR